MKQAMRLDERKLVARESKARADTSRTLNVECSCLAWHTAALCDV